MRGLVALALAAGALVACGASAADGTSSTTSLKVSYWANGPGTQARATWTLRCNPPRGTLRTRAAACRRLASGGVKLFAPIPRDVACTEIYGGPQVARVVGTVNGKSVWASFSRTDGCRIARWDRLAPWLLPRAGSAS
jgi:hypothetical protein